MNRRPGTTWVLKEAKRALILRPLICDYRSIGRLRAWLTHPSHLCRMNERPALNELNPVIFKEMKSQEHTHGKVQFSTPSYPHLFSAPCPASAKQSPNHLFFAASAPSAKQHLVISSSILAILTSVFTISLSGSRSSTFSQHLRDSKQ